MRVKPWPDGISVLITRDARQLDPLIKIRAFIDTVMINRVIIDTVMVNRGVRTL